MLNQLSLYIKNIAVFLIFSTFIEIIMPNNRFKEYIRFVLGIILIVIMIEPINNIIADISKDLDINVMKLETELNKNIIKSENEFYTQKQNEIIKKEFKNSLENQIKAICQKYFIVEDINIILDDSNFEILEIYIYIDNKNGIDEENNILMIKNSISDFYNLSVDNIHITVQRN